MDFGNHFTLVLPSNNTSSPDNTLASFITRLPQRLYLDGSWAGGLREITFTYSYFNVTKEHNLYLDAFRGSEHTHIDVPEGIVIRPGRYETINDLIKAINQALKDILKLQVKPKNKDEFPTVSVDPLDHKVIFTAGKYDQVKADGNRQTPKLIFFYVDFDLMGMLGFERSNQTYQSSLNGKYILKADHSYDLRAGVHSIYVETDLIKPCLIGTTYANVIRVVNAPGAGDQFGDQMIRTYNSVQFYPLLNNDISTIRINLRDATGELIKFQFGHVVATIELKRIG